MVAIPVSTELYFQLNNIGLNTFKQFDTDIAAFIWYLIIGSVMMYAQMHIERHFGRGFGAKKSDGGFQAMRAKMLGLNGLVGDNR